MNNPSADLVTRLALRILPFKTQKHDHQNEGLPTTTHIQLHLQNPCTWICLNLQGEERLLYECPPQTLYNFMLHHTILSENNELKIHRIISDALYGLDVSEECQERIVNNLTYYVLKFQDQMSRADYCNIIPIYMFFMDTRTYDEREVVQQSMEAENCGMVPAKVSAIKSLKRKMIKVEDDKEVENCMICLDEICSGEDIKCMPCDHMFHGDCITTWLSTSHVCPICRYELPRQSPD